MKNSQTLHILLILFTIGCLGLFALQPVIGKDRVLQNLILEQILIENAEKQIFDYYDLDWGAYLTVCILPGPRNSDRYFAFGSKEIRLTG